MEPFHTLPGMRQEGDRIHQVPAQNTKAGWKHLFAFTRRTHAPFLASAAAATILVAGAKTYYAVLLGKIFQLVAEFGSGDRRGQDLVSGVSFWCIILTGMGGLIWLANAAFMALWIIFGELSACSARNILLRSLLQKRTGWFDFQDTGISGLLVGTERQLRELQSGVSQTFGFLICDTLTAVACLAVAFYYSWQLTLVLLGTIPVSFLVLVVLSHGLEPAIEEQKCSLGEASKYATAAVSEIDLVKVYGAADHEVWQYVQAARKATRHYLVQARCNCLQMGYIKLWMMTLFVLGFWFALYLVNEGASTAGDAVTTFYATLIALQAVESLGPQWLVLAKGMAAGHSLERLASDGQGKATAPAQAPRGYRPDSCAGNVEVRDVTFAYPSNPEYPVLRGASLLVPAGEITFIVGRSGSGKSTLGSLLTRLYEPSYGDIFLDGHPLRALDDRWVRRNITLIQQSSILFNDTFATNVALGHRDPSCAREDDIMTACDLALLHSTIAGLPDGLQTMVGPGGYSLSGGQKQRLALARARLRDPPVLVLDEITSGLDPVSRGLVMDALRTWRRGKTTIIITHEVSQIRDLEKVYVMDRGSVIQGGFQRDLARKRGGMFAILLASADGGSMSPPPSASSTRSYVSAQLPPPAYLPERPLQRFSRQSVAEQEVFSTMFNRTSLGASIAQAVRLRPRQAWDAPLFEESASARFALGLGWRVSPKVDSTSYEMDPTPNSAERLSGWPASRLLELPISKNEDVSTAPFRPTSECPNASFDVPKRGPIANECNDGVEASKMDGQPLARAHLTSVLRTLWPSLDSRHRLWLVLGIIFSLATAGCNPAFSYLFARLLQSFWATTDRMAMGRKWAIYLAVVAAIDTVSIFLAHYMMEVTGRAWADDLRTQAFKRILRQPKAWFDLPENASSRVVQCLDRDAEEARNLVGRFIPLVIMAMGMVMAAVVWALVISWKLALVAISAAPAVYAATRLSSAVSGRWEAECNAAATATSAIFTEVFVRIPVVRALTLESFFTEKHARLADAGYILGIRRGVYTGILYGLYQSMSFWFTALVFWYGTILLTSSRGDISVAAVMQVINLLLFSMGTATTMLGSIPQMAHSKVSALNLLHYALLDYNSGHEYSGDRRSLTPLPICMNNAWFAYPSRPDATLLRGVDFRIDAGECVAICGSSGCGKTTLASLLLRLYEPAPIEVSSRPPLTFNYTPATNLDTAFLRSSMAYVPQQPFLFPGSIYDNIVYGLPESSPLRGMSAVRQAARAARIHNLTETLPDGYHTRVGDGGLTLSGGQTQRICVARALARQPSLLVLDEPTSALDAESAERVREAITGLMAEELTWGGMAVVVVTHSREMMRMADRIIMLDEGRIVEEGSYEGLLARQGRFAALVNDQGHT